MRTLLILVWILGLVSSNPPRNPIASEKDFIRAWMSVFWPITVITVGLPKWFNDNVDARFIERKGE